MKHDRQFWTHHVESWRASGLTREGVLRSPSPGEGKPGLLGIDAGSAEDSREGTGGGRANRGRAAPVESAYRVGRSEGRYLLRLWPGMDPAHLREVLSVLEHRG